MIKIILIASTLLGRKPWEVMALDPWYKLLPLQSIFHFLGVAWIWLIFINSQAYILISYKEIKSWSIQNIQCQLKKTWSKNRFIIYLNKYHLMKVLEYIDVISSDPLHPLEIPVLSIYGGGWTDRPFPWQKYSMKKSLPPISLLFFIFSSHFVLISQVI